MKQKVGIADCDTVNFKVYISLADILSHAVIYPEYMAELLDKDHSFEDIEQAYEKTAAIQPVFFHLPRLRHISHVQVIRFLFFLLRT